MSHGTHPDLPSADQTQKASSNAGAKEGNSGSWSFPEKPNWSWVQGASVRLDTGDETQKPEPRRSETSQEEEEETGRAKKLQSIGQEQDWGVGSLDWILVTKEAAAQLKTTGCGQTEIIENVVMEQVIMWF